jgi:Secretion system C-terminal sorting domain
MKKYLILCISALFTNLTIAQNIAINGSSTAEIGITNNYSATFTPAPTDGANVYNIHSVVIIADCAGSIISGGIQGGSNNLQYTFNYSSFAPADFVSTSQTKTVNFSIKWGDNAPNSDRVKVFFYGNYGKIETNGSFNFGNIINNSYKDSKGDFGYKVEIKKVKAPTIINTIFASCSTANVKVCATDYDTANQFIWSISGGTITSGQGSSCINVTPTLTGNLTATCIVSRSSGLPAYTATSTRTIIRDPFTSAAKILGNATFCLTNNYTLSGLLPNETVSWSLSNPTFGSFSTTNSTSTTLNCRKQGDVVLTAKVSNICGDFVLINKNLTVGVNGQIAELTTPSGYPYSYPYYNVPENCSAPLYVFKTSSENTNLNNSTKKMQFTCNGITIIKQPVANYYFFLYASDFNIQENQTFSVTARVGNSCGFATSSTSFLLYRPTACQCSIGCNNNQLPRMANTKVENSNLKLFPNPTNGNITVSLLNALSGNYQIFDQNGSLIQENTFEKTDEFNLDLSNKLSSGIYFLKIITVDNTFAEKIILNNK